MDQTDILINRANMRTDLWKRRAEAAEAACREYERNGLLNVKITPEDAPQHVLIGQNEDLLAQVASLTAKLQRSALVNRLLESDLEREKERVKELEKTIVLFDGASSGDAFRRAAFLVERRFLVLHDYRRKSAEALRAFADVRDKFEDRQRQPQILEPHPGGK